MIVLSEKMGYNKEQEIRLNKFRGCMVGSAAGDALGMPLEF